MGKKKDELRATWHRRAKAAEAEVERLTAELAGGDEFARQAAATPPDAPRRMQANPGTGPVHGVEHDENSWCSGVPCVPVESESVEPEPICTGAGPCPAERHVHGCHADVGDNCDSPDEHYGRPPRASEPTPVEVGQWRADNVSPYLVVEIDVDKVWERRWRDGQMGRRVWMSESRVLHDPVIDPPTVEVAARDLKAGMVEAGTGREVYAKPDLRPDTVTGQILHVFLSWHPSGACEYRDPDALYAIEVQSLPDGWAPSAAQRLPVIVSCPSCLRAEWEQPKDGCTNPFHGAAAPSGEGEA